MTDHKFERLKEKISGMESAVIAYSGGIDSTFLLKVAYDCLGKKAIGVTAVSASVPQKEIEEAKAIAQEIGVRHVLLKSHETEDPRYLENTDHRCYFCKAGAYDEIFLFAGKEKIRHVLDGANADDMDDYRPGRKAAGERGVCSPLLETGITKKEIRRLAKQLGLSNWDKPAAACLSSRVPYGSPITDEKLQRIEKAEDFLKELRLRQVRVRHHEKIARIEVDPADFPLIISHREEIIGKFREIGFLYVTLDLAGFRSGSMNEVLKK